MSLFRTKDFLKLKEYWDQKLKDSGFEDIETNGQLNRQRQRTDTIAFQNREQISEFFSALTRFLEEQQNLPQLHRQVLALYAEGMHVKGPRGIVHKVDRCDATVRNIIRKYKLLILRN